MRSTRSTRLATATLTAAVAVGGLVIASPAQADPTPAGTFRKLVGVGSDTTQDVLNALAGDTVNGTSYAATAVTANGNGIASYDAVDPSTGTTHGTITTRSGGTAFTRPNGSGEGRKALSATLTGTADVNGSNAVMTGNVDFARSSGGPSVSGTGITGLTYIPMARDAVGVVVRGSALANLTIAQLHDIYSSSTPVTINGQVVHPYIPQGGSGTRKFFLAAIGLQDSEVPTDTVTVVQENQANDAMTADGAIEPFSVASWIAQNNGIAPDHSKTAAADGAYMAGIELDPTGAAGTYTSPVATTDGVLSGVESYYNSATFGRDVFNVVRTAAVDPTSIFYDDNLYDAFVTSGTHKAALASDDSKKVIASFGFLNESYNGSIDPTKHAKYGGLENSASVVLPDAPLVTTTPGSGTLKVGWTGTSGGLAITDYRLLLTDADGAVVVNKDVPASTSTYTFTGLTPGKYTASVTANNLTGAGTPTTWTGSVKYGSTTTASAATTAYGKAPKVAVTVKGSHSVAPVGKVTVKEGTTTLGTGTLNSTTGKVTITLSNHLKVAKHSLTVTYAGTSKLYSSSTTASLTVTKASAAISSSAPSSISHTKKAKVAVKVTATGTTPGGKVQIMQGTKVLATGTLSGGKVTVTLPKLSKGKHTLHVHYLGSSTVAAKNGANFVIKST